VTAVLLTGAGDAETKADGSQGRRQGQSARPLCGGFPGRCASDGLTDREIGDRLFLSPRTVSSHLYRSYPKLGVASRHQLRDVIAITSTPATAHESTGSETLR
jgi:Bacterial regulatory proteins, luxR family